MKLLSIINEVITDRQRVLLKQRPKSPDDGGIFRIGDDVKEVRTGKVGKVNDIRGRNLIVKFDDGETKVFGTYDNELDFVHNMNEEHVKLPVKAPMVKDIKKDNSGVIHHFLDQTINPKITSFGTPNLKIVKYPNGYGLVNYSTLIGFRTWDNDVYVNNKKYSVSTSQIQSKLTSAAKDSDLGGVIGFVDENEIYDIAQIENETSSYPYQDKLGENISI